MKRILGAGLVSLALSLAAGCSVNDRMRESLPDPVCGKLIDRKTATITRVYLRKTYYFDREECAGTFDRHPARYCDVASAMYPEYDY